MMPNTEHVSAGTPKLMSAPPTWPIFVLAILALGAITISSQPRTTPEAGGEIANISASAGEHQRPTTHGPLSREEIRAILTEEAGKPRFDGIVHGWRVAPLQVLRAEGNGGINLNLDCQARRVGEEASTDLDMILTYFPSTLPILEEAEQVKWACGERGVNVELAFVVDTPLGPGELSIYRTLRGNRIVPIVAPNDKVEEGTIDGKDAILVHPADDETGLGYGRIIILEEVAQSEFIVTYVSADNGIPFDELVRVAEGIE